MFGDGDRNNLFRERRGWLCHLRGCIFRGWLCFVVSIVVRRDTFTGRDERGALGLGLVLLLLLDLLCLSMITLVKENI